MKTEIYRGHAITLKDKTFKIYAVNPFRENGSLGELLCSSGRYESTEDAMKEAQRRVDYHLSGGYYALLVRDVVVGVGRGRKYLEDKNLPESWVMETGKKKLKVGEIVEDEEGWPF